MIVSVVQSDQYGQATYPGKSPLLIVITAAIAYEMCSGKAKLCVIPFKATV